MASINNVEIKNLKEFSGHDGGGYLQGNVYLNGRKLGFWSQDAWCGPDSFDFDEHALSDACEKFKEGFPDDFRYKEYADSPDVFMSTVCMIKRLEKDLNKSFKRGYPAIILVTDGHHVSWLSIPEDMPDDALLVKYSDDVEEMKEGMFKNEPPKIHIFRSGTFDFIVDKEHPAPQLFY